MSTYFSQEASYEPELHPGVTYKLKQPKATLKVGIFFSFLIIDLSRVLNCSQSPQVAHIPFRYFVFDVLIY
jgi:hypothetical protein